MSNDLLAAAAEALGAPPEIVMRSATARASAEGVSVEEILASWAGGAAAPTREAPAKEEVPPEVSPVKDTAPAIEPPEAERPAYQALEVPTPEAPAVVTRTVARAPSITELPAPLLEGRSESPGRLLVAVIALFLAGFLGSVVLPSLAVERSGVSVVRSEAAEAGRGVYVREGCGYCHTQLVRPIVTDARLGAVTEASALGSELPSTVGWLRIGPDLAHLASREGVDPVQLEALLLDEGTRPHQSYRSLSESDLEALVAYLLSLR